MNLEAHYTCELCSDILIDPVFHQCCTDQYDDEKLFCRDCLENYYELNDASGIEGQWKQTLKPCDCSFKRCVDPGKVVRTGTGSHGSVKSFMQVRALWPLLDTLRTDVRCRRHGCGFVGKNHEDLMNHISTNCAYTRIRCPFKGCAASHYSFVIHGEHRRLFHEYVWCDECDHAVANVDWVDHVKRHWMDIRLCTVQALCAAHKEHPSVELSNYLRGFVTENGTPHGGSRAFNDFLSGFVNMTKDARVCGYNS